ncbi:MAG TPA: amidase [Candidatus Dormibacteraeota bacterium]
MNAATLRWAVTGLGVVALTVGCGNRSPGGFATPTTTRTTAAATATVRVEDNSFTPQVLTVPEGATVEWQWGGRNPHNVTGDDFASPDQSSGGFDRSFSRSGTHSYRCTIHPHMLGEVVVR